MNIPSLANRLKHRNIKAPLFILAAVLLGFLLGRQQTLAPKGDALSVAQLKRELARKDFTFINVHTPYEGEIEKTDAFISYDKIVENSNLLPKDKNAPIVLYCKTGRMSAEALETIKKLGYTNVRHLSGGMDAWGQKGSKVLDLSTLENDVLPTNGFTLPVSWGTIGPKLIELGVIDLAKWKKAVTMTPEQEAILTQGSENPIVINHANGQFVVDLLWALGLAQKSLVYDEGPLGKEYKDEVANFASTGGWNLAKSDAVNYLGKFDLIPLTESQQEIVGEIAKNVYRPCCGNSTWFPDCNHGMAALAAIELMVSAGVPEEEIYRHVLALNSFWFPDTYLTLATYFARQGTAWSQVDAKELLGQKYSSGQGAADIAKKVGPIPYATTSGGSCGT